MQRGFGPRNLLVPSSARWPSKISVIRSDEPPPPPPPLEELELELELELDELPPEELEELDPGVGPDVTATGQGVAPAEAGAWVVAELAPTTTSAVSIRPWLSVTVTRRVTDPVVGTSTVALLVFAPRIAGEPAFGATMLQAKPTTVRPQAAALAEALKEAFWPPTTVRGRLTAAMGRSAASTEAAASAMPAPQVVVVQRH